MRNVWDKSCRGDQNTHFVCNNFPPPPKIVPLWDNVEKYCRGGRPQMTISRMPIACWISKATDTFTMRNTYCFFSAAWLLERASRYTIRTLSYWMLNFPSYVILRCDAASRPRRMETETAPLWKPKKSYTCLLDNSGMTRFINANWLWCGCIREGCVRRNFACACWLLRDIPDQWEGFFKVFPVFLCFITRCCMTRGLASHLWR